jgi:hypothetical protein
MSTIDQVVDRLAPAVEPFDPEWSASTLTAILEHPKPARRRRRRPTWIAAAAVLAAVAVPTVLSSGSASARVELMHLAVVAASSDEPVITPGTFLHVRTESLQENSSILGDGHRLDTDRESWIRWDGATWAVDTRPSVGWTEHHYFAAPREVSPGTPTPAFVASLPDTPRAMRDYLDRTVSGSSSHDEALFVAIGDLASSRMLDQRTFATALQVLADVDGVSTEDVVVDGREAVEIQFDRFLGLGFVSRSSITVDSKTAQLLRVVESSAASTYTSKTTTVDVVDEVPASVLAAYRAHGDGSRICADGSEARDTEDPAQTCS